MSGPQGEFTFGTRLGLAFAVQAASCSAILVSSLLIYILYSAVTIKRGASRTWNVSSHVHYYFVNLLFFDLIQAIGGIMDAKWVAEGIVKEGLVCTAQGILKQMGDVGVALSTAAIALHTFSVLVLRRHPPTRLAFLFLFLIWLFIGLIVGLSLATHKGKDYYGNTVYWCWITGNYSFQRIALEYFWLWLAVLINVFCYGIMALVVKGALVIDGAGWRYLGWRHQKRMSLGVVTDLNLTGQDRVESSAVATHMLFYPLIYIIAVTPITVVRWLSFAGSDVPFPATAFASITFGSSGVFNVLLFALTRPKLLPHREHRILRSISSSQAGRGSPLSTVAARNTPIDQFGDVSMNWKITPRTIPSELPVLHITV